MFIIINTSYFGDSFMTRLTFLDNFMTLLSDEWTNANNHMGKGVRGGWERRGVSKNQMPPFEGSLSVNEEGSSVRDKVIIG